MKKNRHKKNESLTSEEALADNEVTTADEAEKTEKHAGAKSDNQTDADDITETEPEDMNSFEESDFIESGFEDPETKDDGASVEAGSGTEKQMDASGFDNMTLSRIYELCDSFKDEKVMEDIVSDSFRIFAKGKSGTAEDIYSEYLKLKQSFCVPARGNSGQELSVKENYSYDRLAPSKNPSSSLTKKQMEIARSAGMSFREYEELLNSLPVSSRHPAKRGF